MYVEDLPAVLCPSEICSVSSGPLWGGRGINLIYVQFHLESLGGGFLKEQPCLPSLSLSPQLNHPGQPQHSAAGILQHWAVSAVAAATASVAGSSLSPFPTASGGSVCTSGRNCPIFRWKGRESPRASRQGRSAPLGCPSLNPKRRRAAGGMEPPPSPKPRDPAGTSFLA